jgi:bifunctional oligoribonuclease and PAP phosphatase NrnA
MNYEESKIILDEINKSQKILINCHKDPDPDSIGSALAFRNVLMKIGKSVEILCVSPALFDQVSYLPGYDQIKTNVDFGKFDYSKFDLLLVLDSSSIDRVTGDKNSPKIPLKTIVIDHHKTNTRFADVNIVDENKTSAGEILYVIFEDCNFNIDKDTADCLMAAIVGDTGAFRYPNTSTKTFDIVKNLIEKGADKDRAIQNIYRNENFSVLKFWGEVLTRMNLNEKGKYVWSAVPYEVFVKCGMPDTGKETAASGFVQIVKGSEFGFVAVEEEKRKLKISFRSRTGFDTSEIASELGGGGHIYASGASINDMDFDEAVKKLLAVVDKFTVKML